MSPDGLQIITTGTGGFVMCSLVTSWLCDDELTGDDMTVWRDNRMTSWLVADTDVSWLYSSINLPQLGGMWAALKSTPISWWSERHTDSSVMTFLESERAMWPKKRSRHFNDSGNWRAVSSLPDRSAGNVSGISTSKWTLSAALLLGSVEFTGIWLGLIESRTKFGLTLAQ